MISPIENNGMVMRMQDFSSIRQNEENVSVNQHMQIQDTLDKTDDANAHTVREQSDSDGADTRHDAREEGRNKYFDNRKKKGQNSVPLEGRMVAKGRGGFDITV